MPQSSGTHWESGSPYSEPSTVFVARESRADHHLQRGRDFVAVLIDADANDYIVRSFCPITFDDRIVLRQYLTYDKYGLLALEIGIPVTDLFSVP